MRGSPEAWNIVDRVLATALPPVAEGPEIPTILLELGGILPDRLVSLEPGLVHVRRARELACSRMEGNDGSAVAFDRDQGADTPSGAVVIELWLKGMTAPVRYLQRYRRRETGTPPLRLGLPMVLGTCSWLPGEEDDEAQGATRTRTQESCTRCGALLFYRTVTRGLFSRDEWYECETCGYFCPECKALMALEEKDTSSGTEYRSYRCRECRHELCIEQGIAMAEAYRLINEQSKNRR